MHSDSLLQVAFEGILKKTPLFWTCFQSWVLVGVIFIAGVVMAVGEMVIVVEVESEDSFSVFRI